MTYKEILKRIDQEILWRELFMETTPPFEKILEARTEPLWSGIAVYSWKEDLEFYKHIRSLIEGEKK